MPTGECTAGLGGLITSELSPYSKRNFIASETNLMPVGKGVSYVAHSR